MAAAWYRTAAQGFDPHIHWVLIGDSPLGGLAGSQIDMYRKGYDGLGWYSNRDSWTYRPASIHDYQYIEDEDDMFTDKDRATLEALRDRMNTGFANERERDTDERQLDATDREQDKAQFTRMVTMLGQTADQLTVLINSTGDDATKKDLRAAKERILRSLRDDPAVVGVDNPSDEGMEGR